MNRRILPAMLILATGCHHQYRLLDDNFAHPLEPFKMLPLRTAVPLPLPMVEHNLTFDTAYIEFNDQGKMFDPSPDPHQEAETLKLIKEKKPSTILLYVHGWNNNASENSADVTRFRAGLNYLSRQPSLNGPLLGIFIGWRGGTLKDGLLGPFTFLTYWSRKEGARRMAYGDLTGVLDELVKVAHDVRPDSRFFAMGHSFGARVLEGALQQSVQFTSIFDALAKGDRNYHPPIDMVLLINPATDSMLTRQFIDRIRKVNTSGFVIHHPDWKPGICGATGSDRNNRLCHPYPLMVEMSSVGDIPTGVAMPIANFVNWVPPMPLVAHPSARLRSAPFTPDLRTHRLLQCAPGRSDGPCGPQNENVEFDFPMMATKGQPWGRVERLDPRVSPFVWVLKVNREISENHGDVWNENVAAMMLAIIDPAGSRLYTPDMVQPSPSPEAPAPAASQRTPAFEPAAPGIRPALPQGRFGQLPVEDFAFQPTIPLVEEVRRPQLGPPI